MFSIDDTVQEPIFADFAMNNTYGIQLYSEKIYKKVLHNYHKPGGCKDQIQKCKDASRQYGDDGDYGDIEKVNKICIAADNSCDDDIGDGVYAEEYGDRSLTDITQPVAGSFPPEWWIGYLNQPHVQVRHAGFR
jgi:hypothetical protein